jgi:hypothetical protein
MKKKLLFAIFAVFFVALHSVNAQNTGCGQLFTDPEGPNANYSNNADHTVTICPNNPGDVVTVVFTAFDLETNFDGLYIYNGPSTSSQQISSTNGIGNIPGALPGAFWGTASPGTVTSTDPSGCLTFRFRSDGSVTKAGWIANVICGAAGNCPSPNNLFATNFTGTTATIGWVESGSATQWEVIVLPAGSPQPTSSSVGTLTTTNPFFVDGLTPGVIYMAYVRAVCGTNNEDSAWSIPLTIFTSSTNCTPPTNLSVTNITTAGATLNWAMNNSSQWEVVVLPSNGGLPTPNTSGTIVTTNSFTATGLNANTAYNFFIRSVCDNNVSAWSNGTYFITSQNPIIPPVCGELFVDNGGANGNYSNNADNTYVICPTNPGDLVTVTFNTFDVESIWDGLYVYDGNSISAPQISSGNAGTNIPGGIPGAFWGTAIPGPFTSTSADGCLTFRFRSDNVINKAGWTASVTCEPAPTCPKPTFVTTTAVTANSALVGWTSNSNATSWEILVLPCGTNPTATSTGIVVTSIPFDLTNLSPATCYNVYVRSICSATDISNWSAPATFTTSVTCPSPVQAYTSDITTTSITLNWFEQGTATSWEVIGVPCGAPAPSANDTGIISSSTSHIFTGLNPLTCYSFYVRSVCSTTDSSTWSGPLNETTSAVPPGCGGNFIDPAGPAANYANNTDSTVTICPNNPGEIVTVTFTSFSTEANWDALFVYDGSSINAPQIASSNGAGFSALSNMPGGFWGNNIPGPFTSSSPDGCLTFRFISDSSIVMAGWTANVTCEQDDDKIILIAFVDSNNNGIKDADEVNFSNGSFLYDLNDAGTPMTGYSPTGQYAIYDSNPSNSYDINYQLQSSYAPYYSAGTTNYTNVTIPVGSLYQILYFPITVIQGYNDVTVSIVSQNPPPRPGFTYTNKIVYKNMGLTPTSGTLTFVKGAAVTITNISQVGTTSTTNGFTYAFTNLAPNETRYITVTMQVPTLPTVALGDLITNSSTITAPADDIDLENNSFSITQTIVGSYDPNDKMEAHGGRILITDYNPSDYLFYTIRFQNEGTAAAEFVIIEDLLDAQIDEATVQMVSASHAYVMTRMNNQIIWDFRNINLAPKSVNEPESMGYVLFKAKLKPGIEVGDIVPNTANIFFDFNPAIVTNTFNTEFVAPLSTVTFSDNNFALYPNPAKGLVTIELQNTTETIQKISITDVLGKTVRYIENSTNLNTINVSDLTNGVYFVEITTNSNLKQVRKLVKN